MQLHLNYADIIMALKGYYKEHNGVQLDNIELNVKWDQEYDSKPDQTDFSVTADFKIIL